jgi:site-specific DNA recombinase
MGKAACKGRSFPMDRLDDLVIEHVKKRVLEPSRLSDLLTSLKTRRQASDAEVQALLLDLRSETAKADEKIRRLFKMVEDGMTELDDLLAERLATLKTEREIAKGALERSQFQSRPEIIFQTVDVQQFSEFMSEKITFGDNGFRRNYLRSIIEGVEVDDKVIRIRGSKGALEHAVSGGDSTGKGVRGFIRNWRTRHDSNVRPPPSEGGALSN